MVVLFLCSYDSSDINVIGFGPFVNCNRWLIQVISCDLMRRELGRKIRTIQQYLNVIKDSSENGFENKIIISMTSQRMHNHNHN